MTPVAAAFLYEIFLLEKCDSLWDMVSANVFFSLKQGTCNFHTFKKKFKCLNYAIIESSENVSNMTPQDLRLLKTHNA